MTKLITLSGSIRDGSNNTKLAQLAARKAEELGASAEFVDLANYDMPIYNEDLEEKSGLPDGAKALKAKFVEADGFFISTPEYNSSYTPILKNALDWISRKESADEQSLLAFANKGSGIAAASPGGLGGIRALVPLRLMLANVGVNVVGSQMALSQAHKAFDDQGNFTDAKFDGMLTNIITQLIRVSRA